MEKNKKLLLIIIGIILSLLILILPIIFLVKGTISGVGNIASSNSKTITNSEEIEKKVEVSQSEAWISAFSTEEVEDTKELAHVKIWVNANLFHMDAITSYTVKNIKVEGYKKGKVAIVKPGHISNTLSMYNYVWGPYEDEMKSADIKDSGKTLTFDVVDVASYYDEVSKVGTSMPTWGIFLKELGQFNYREIMDSENLFESVNVLKYASVEPNDVNMSISFDVEMVFEDGTKWVKRFSAELDGVQIVENNSYSVQLSY
ncbi:hypothetical protein KKA50_01715 [Patescibacteria group bacterium]|nr:hypothetical protein [Patescibacteria group bacterium]